MHTSGQEQTALFVQAQQRAKIREAVRERFARHGDAICMHVLTAALSPRGLQRMLEKLGLNAPTTLEIQMDRLAGFIADQGRVSFLRKIENRKLRTESPMGEISAYASATTGASAEGGVAAAAPRGGKPLAGPTGRRGATPNQSPDEWFDAQGRYCGPERRMKNERREAGDRRDRSDLINRNKRYGGDRRRQPRRLCDRSRGQRVGAAA